MVIFFNIIKKYFTPTYLILIVFFAISYVNKNLYVFKNYFLNANPYYLLLSAGTLLICYIFLFITFRLIQCYSEKPENLQITTLQWMKAFFFGYIGRYIPGKVSIIIGRIKYLSDFGFSKRSIVITALYENLLLIIIQMIISVPVIFLAKADSHFMRYMFGMIFFIAAAIIFISTPIFEKLFKLALNILKREQFDNSVFLTHKQIIVAALYGSISILMVAVSFYFFCVSIVGTEAIQSMNSIYAVGATYTLACAIGILVLFAPSGLGVREAIVLYILTNRLQMMPGQAVILAVVCYRILQIVIEAIIISGIYIASILSEKKA